jgi:hypothetical protein
MYAYVIARQSARGILRRSRLFLGGGDKRHCDYTTAQVEKMLKTEFSSNPLPASSYIPSGVPVSSSSFILPQVPAPIGHDHLLSLPPDQTSPSSSSYPAVNGFSQQVNGNVVGKKRKPRRAVEQEIIDQASDRFTY